MANANDRYQPYTKIPRLKNRCGQIDTHELLKREMEKQDAEVSGNTGNVAPIVVSPQNSHIPPGVGPEYPLTPSPGFLSAPSIGYSKPPTSQYGFVDSELYFDSLYRDSSSNFAIGEIKWSIPVQNNLQDIKNCVEMTIDGDFFIPKVNVPATQPEFFYFRKLYMFVESAQIPSLGSVSGPNGNKFHFEFDILNLTGQAVLLSPVKPSFFFPTPITSISDFWIRLMVPTTNPANPTMVGVPIPAERVTMVAIPGSNPIQFVIDPTFDTTVLGLIGSLGAPGVAVFITNFNSVDAPTNNIVNNPAGVFATTVDNITTFTIAAIDGSAVAAPTVLNPNTASMFIPKNRIAFPFRFTSVVQQPSNYISVAHL